MDDTSPRQDGPGRDRRRIKSQSYRRQSAPSLVLSKALTRSKTLSRESFLVPVNPESCPLVQSLLSASGRSFLLHGHAQLKTGMQTQDRHLFLFSDILVVAKAKSANAFKQKLQVGVSQMWTASCTEEVCEGSTDPGRSFVMGWPTWNCVALFSSAEQKERWISVLRSRIREEKEQEEPKTIPLRVYGKGINTFAVTKTLPVSNSDSTNEVIRLALQQFGILGNVRDFQLWVVSKRDNTPYPLIGHEFPFSIQMSHVSDSAPHDSDWQVEHLQVYRQCQFILKPRPAQPPPPHTIADPSRRSFTRRRSLVTWAFWRGASPHLGGPTQAGASRGCLFNQPLSSVCVEDALPKPVMDMLVFLYHEGSCTRGIFRRSAGARAVRELREALDSGRGQLPLTREHVFIIAGVFKEFLRSLPGSLLGCELYQEWVELLEEEEEEEEQVQDIRRMVSRLAKENALLLRYLLAMLHGVHCNAAHNQMTSFNLSVCIAPSLLWPPRAPCSPELEGEDTKKVCELVKFMIEHCPQILSEDPSSLFGGPPQNRTDSDSWPLTDSSYDSLENELDDSSGGSPGFCSRRSGRAEPLRSSLESILTFSDSDQDAALQGRPSDLHQTPSDVSARLDSLSLEGPQGQRRCSEPAIAYAARFCPYLSGSTDELTGRGAELGAELGVSPPSRSSSWNMERTAETNSGTPAVSIAPVPSNPAKDPQHRAALKSCMGLHPNSWLKKDRRLSLTQQESLEKDEDDKMAHSDRGPRWIPGTEPKPSRRGSKDSGDQKARPKAGPCSLSRNRSSAGSLRFPKAAPDAPRSTPSPEEPCRQLQVPTQLCSSRGGPGLSLFRSGLTEPGGRLRERRGSEPGQQLVDRAGATTRSRLPSDPGLRGAEPAQPRFCVSPCTTKAVRDYFSLQPHQQGALRCSGPEPDLEQLLFSEESYV